MLNAYRSHSLELLVQKLGEDLDEHNDDLMRTQTIIVPSNGVGEWLNKRLIESKGTLFNVNFSLIRSYMWSLFRRLDAIEIPQETTFSPTKMQWYLLDWVNSLQQADPHGLWDEMPLSNRALSSIVERYSFATQLASIFSRYMYFRPDWINADFADEALNWPKGSTKSNVNWQKAAWHYLLERINEPHRPHLLKELQEAITTDSFKETVSVFCPQMLENDLSVLLAGAAQSSAFDVSYYQRANISPNVFLEGLNLRPSDATDDETAFMSDDLAGSVGGKIIRVCGHRTKQLQTLEADISFAELEDLMPIPSDESSVGQTLLGKVKDSIFHLTDTAEGASWEADDTITVVAAQGVWREVELLRDYLLNEFAENPELQCHEVAVYTPQLDKYMPFIEAVFNAPDERFRIPFHQLSQETISESAIVEFILNLLSGVGTAKDAPQPLLLAHHSEFLHLPQIVSKFKLNPAEIDDLLATIDSYQGRRGYSAISGTEALITPLAEQSVDSALSAILTKEFDPGFTPSLNERYGLDYTELNSVLRALDALERTRLNLAGQKSIAEWLDLMPQVIALFEAPYSDSSAEWRFVLERFSRVCTRTLLEMQTHSDIKLLSAEFVVTIIKKALEREISQVGIFRGEVPIGDFVDRSGVPFKQICVLGMNDTNFPGMRHGPHYDLLEQTHLDSPSHSRPGDPNWRDEGLGAFLALFGDAGEKLYISHLSYDPETGSSLVPALPLRTLTEALTEKTAHGDKPFAKRKSQVLPHLLNDASETTFPNRNEEWLSHTDRDSSDSETRETFFQRYANYADDQGSNSGPTAGATNVSKKRVISVDELVDFLACPPRFWARERNVLKFGYQMRDISDAETFSLKSWERNLWIKDIISKNLLDKYGVTLKGIDFGADFLPKMYGLSAEEQLELVKSSGQKAMNALHKVMESAQGEDGRVSCSVNETRIQLQGDILLRDEIETLELNGANEHLLVHFGSMKMTDRSALKNMLRYWIKHALVSALGVAEKTKIIDVKKVNPTVWDALQSDTAKEYLNDLASLYLRGILKPLPFDLGLAVVRWGKDLEETNKDLWFDYAQEYRKHQPKLNLAIGIQDYEPYLDTEFEEIFNTVFKLLREVTNAKK